MASQCPFMLRIFKILPLVSESDSTVLIQGETGTGKELMAKAIHDLSPRREKPFIAVNCGGLPDTLLESELFGYKAGAFTGATKDKPGRFEIAEDGTIFLDEIGDLSTAFQVRLLRVLQDRIFLPLGGTKPIKANVRIIAATNKDLDGLVKSGKFRQDLFYRINVIRLDIPPLRERKEDIPMLMKSFINRRNRLLGMAATGITQKAFSLLMGYHYPGNIRELENIIEHALVLCPEGEIGIDCLPENLRDLDPRLMPQVGMEGALKSTEARVILDALKRNNYNRLVTARKLDMHKSTLYRKIKKLGIKLPEVDGRAKHKQS